MVHLFMATLKWHTCVKRDMNGKNEGESEKRREGFVLAGSPMNLSTLEFCFEAGTGLCTGRDFMRMGPMPRRFVRDPPEI